MNEKKLNITSLGQVSHEAIFVPVNVKPARIAAATLIYDESLLTVDKVYPKLSPTNSLLWSEVSCAHTILTSKGEYFLLLVSESDIFGESKGIFIELLDFPPKVNQLGELFTAQLKKRINEGVIACYRNDLEWL